MKVIIIEDEQPAKNRLERMLKECNPVIEVVEWLEDVESSVEYFKTNPIADLVFMDIQLADGVSFEIFQETNINVPIIFTTAYDEYALQAFKVNSIDYLLKPFQKEDLEKSIEKLQALKQSENSSALLTSLLDDFSQQKKVYKKRFLIKLGTQYLPVDVEEIAYFYAEDKMVYAKLFSERKFLIDTSLDDLEKQLDPVNYFRVNRKVLANQKGIATIHQHFNGKLKLELTPDFDTETLVSREKSTPFKKWMAFG